MFSHKNFEQDLIGRVSEKVREGYSFSTHAPKWRKLYPPPIHEDARLL